MYYIFKWERATWNKWNDLKNRIISKSEVIEKEMKINKWRKKSTKLYKHHQKYRMNKSDNKQIFQNKH